MQVPKLNASELGGQPASAFLGVNGTAANSNELGHIPANGFVQGGGTISDGRLTLTQGVGTVLVTATWWNSNGGVGQGTVNDTSHIRLTGLQAPPS